MTFSISYKITVLVVNKDSHDDVRDSRFYIELSKYMLTTIVLTNVSQQLSYNVMHET